MTRRVIIDVDERGRVSLARFGLKDIQLVVDQLPDGGLVVHRAVPLTEVEVAHYRSAEAVASLERGFQDAEAGRTRRLTLRSDR